MGVWRKWLHIAAVFILTLSLLSPAAMAEEVQFIDEQNSADILAEDGALNEHIADSESKSIKINEQGPITIAKGSTNQLTATVLPQNTTNDSATITWTSSNEAVATVDDGLLTAVNDGETTVTAIADDVSTTIDVVVKTEAEVTITVDVRVEGYKGTILNIEDFEVTSSSQVTAADVTEQVLTANNIPYNLTSSGMFSHLNNEENGELSIGSGWMYKVNEVYPDVGAPSFEMHTGDEIVWHYTNYPSVIDDYYYGYFMGSGVGSVDKVTFEPIIEMPETATANTPLTIKITGKYDIVDFGFKNIEENLTANLGQVTIVFNGKEYITDETGEVTIPAEDMITGEYELKFTKDLPGTLNVWGKEKVIDSFPRIIRTYKSLLVQQGEENGEKPSPEANRQTVEQAIAKAQQYLAANSELVSPRVNGSSSGYWMLSAMYAAGVDIESFSWTVAPTSEGTHWSNPINAAMPTENEILGSIIGANFLGLDATKLKNRNFVADLLAKKTPAGTYTTQWGEPWAMIALDLEKPTNYDQASHIAAALKAQNATTGYFGDLDLTGWWLIALAPHRDQPEVEAAIQKAVTAYHKEFMVKGFKDNANTMASIISGLASVEEDLFSEKWTYEKDGQQINIVAHLANHYQLEDGSISFKAGGSANLMALEQVYIAFADALHQKSTYVRLAEDIASNPGEKPEKPLPEANRQTVEEAIVKAQQYLVANNALISTRVNESPSGYWMLSAMYAAGLEIQSFPWTVAPATEGTHWSTPIDKAMPTGNEILGSIIGANFLGLDATKLKNRNFVADLLARKTAAGTYTTMWGEPWAMIALDLEKPASYDQASHIAAALKVQNATTGYFGDLDLTGWWLIALAPHRDQPEVEAAIQKAVAAYHKEFMEKGFKDNANTMAAIISGLASVGEDLFSEKWTYEKDGQQINIVAHLANHYQLDDGGIRWKATDNKSNLMALEQVYMAFADALHQKSTYVRFVEGITTTPGDGGTNPGGDGNPGSGNGPGTGSENTEQARGYVSIQAGSSTYLPLTEVQFTVGQTAFDLLRLAAEANGVTVQYRSTSMGIYVYGINGLEEFDRGPLSGWMYKVNGMFPEYSAANYIVQPEDIIEWVYTEDLGNDVGSPPTEDVEGDKDKEDNEAGKEDNNGNDIVIPENGINQDDGITVETVEGEFKASISIAAIEELLQDDTKKQLTLKSSEGVNVILPTAVFKGQQLPEDTKVNVSVKQSENSISVNMYFASAEGDKISIQTGKDYAKIIIPMKDIAENTVVLQSVNGEYKAVPHKIVNGEVIIFTKTSGEFVLINEQVTFNDIDKLANKEDIEFLASRYVIKGVNTGEFAPNKAITRAQFAAMISRALGLQASSDNQFKDTTGKWYAPDVQALFEAGITNGKTADTFDPEANITRQQAAAFMARVLEYMNYEAQAATALDYNDASQISAEFKEQIALLASLDIMTGKADGTFDAAGQLTRAQMAKILKRTLNKAGLM